MTIHDFICRIKAERRVCKGERFQRGEHSMRRVIHKVFSCSRGMYVRQSPSAQLIPTSLPDIILVTAQ